MALRLSWRDLAALATALAAFVAGIALWADGRVAIGLELAEGTNPETNQPSVFVRTVVPDGNAARNHIGVNDQVVVLSTHDGDGTGAWLDGLDAGGEPLPLPAEAVPADRIEGVVTGQVYVEDNGEEVVWGHAALDRSWLEARLQNDVYAVGLGVALAVLIAAVSVRGWLGTSGRRLALVGGVVAALPLLLVPVVEVGNAFGIYATYAALLATSLVLAHGLSEELESGTRRRAALGAAIGAAGIAVALIVRHMQTPMLSPDERGPIAILLALVPLAPAVVLAMDGGRAIRARAEAITLGALPGVSSLAIMPSDVQPLLPALIIVPALLLHGLPWERMMARLAASFAALRSESASAPPGRARVRTRELRNVVSLAVVGVALLGALTQDGAWSIVLATVVGLVIVTAGRRGVLGDAWTDAAVPIAASVAVPILLAPMASWYSAGHPAIVVPTTVATLVVAHLIAERHSDPAIGARLFGVASGLAVLLVIGAVVLGLDLAAPVIGLIPLIPGVPVAFAERDDEAAVSWRLETMAVALTPLAATTVLAAAGLGAVVLGTWLAALVVWRYFALNPLIGIARRTELQRDVAVAAAETERARLAADLHDDALQQLTMLVRTLDEGGHSKEADEAREIATKLRSVVGDLRLPILDDLGAGAALEWLVERVEPLAGGPVKLERSDETRPPANVELAVFRVAQEALTNAIKHGRPPIAVRYDVRTDGRVTLAIDDAGEGIGSDAADEAPREGHFGLVNMQQRAEQIGALLDVRRWPAGGTRVALEWRPQ
jgi:signal transduction histidine kinase